MIKRFLKWLTLPRCCMCDEGVKPENQAKGWTRSIHEWCAYDG